MEMLTGSSINLSLVLYPNSISRPMGEGHNIRLTVWLGPNDELRRAQIIADILEKFDHQDLKQLPEFSEFTTNDSIGVLQLGAAICTFVAQSTNLFALTLEYGQQTVQLKNATDGPMLQSSLSFDLSTVAKSGEPIVRKATLSVTEKLTETAGVWESLEAVKNTLVNTVNPSWWPTGKSDAYALSQICELVNAKHSGKPPILVELKHVLTKRSWSTLTR